MAKRVTFIGVSKATLDDDDDEMVWLYFNIASTGEALFAIQVNRDAIIQLDYCAYEVKRINRFSPWGYDIALEPIAKTGSII
jgi:hypothetical protein